MIPTCPLCGEGEVEVFTPEAFTYYCRPCDFYFVDAPVEED